MTESDLFSPPSMISTLSELKKLCFFIKGSSSDITIIIFLTYSEHKKGSTAFSITDFSFIIKYCFGISEPYLEPVPAPAIIASRLSFFIFSFLFIIEDYKFFIRICKV